MDPLTAPTNPIKAREEEDHEKKPTMQKIKDKVKKIKDTMTKKAHGPGGNGDDEDRHQHGDMDDSEEGYEEDEDITEDVPEVHGAPIYESSTSGSRPGSKEMTSGGGEVPEVHGAPIYESSTYGLRPGSKEMSSRGGDDGVGVGLGKNSEFVLDPDAPRTATETDTRMEENRGGEEVEISPELSRSFEAMAVSSQKGGGETQKSEEKSLSYTDRLSSAKDAAASVASTVYGKVSEVGTVMMSKVTPDTKKDGTGDEATREQDKGVSFMDYVVGKLTPGEDEKALSGVITEAVQNKKDGVGEAVQKRKNGAGEAVLPLEREGEAVQKSKDGAGEAMPLPERAAEAVQKRKDGDREAVQPPERSGSDQGGGGVGVVENLRGMVTSFLGGGGSGGVSGDGNGGGRE